MYKVHYLGTSDSADEWVSVAQIRNIDSATPLTVLKEQIQMSSTDCNFRAPVAPVANSLKFSEKLVKRKVYEWLLADNKQNNKRIGVEFLFLKTGEPYINSVSISDKAGLVRKNVAAPAGALIYPVKAKYKLCKEAQEKITTSIVDGNFCCYRNGKGIWECSPDN